LIIDLLFKNIQEQQLNSRRFPEGISDSSRFPEVVDTLYGPSLHMIQPPTW